MAAPQVTQTKVRVSFPLAPGKPFSATEPDDTTIGAVRSAAMRYFGVHEDPGSRYYLTHGEAGDEVADGATVGQVAGRAHSVKFTLVKELIQG
jgi:hypothetical protein